MHAIARARYLELGWHPGQRQAVCSGVFGGLNGVVNNYNNSTAYANLPSPRQIWPIPIAVADRFIGLQLLQEPDRRPE